jgi:hypothetical protein
MPVPQKPIKRVWKSKVPAVLPARPKFDIYGHEVHAPDVQEINTDSIWDTFEALQAAEAERLAKLNRQ